jgi:hypothetical protein
MSKSQQLISTMHKLHTHFFLFWFKLFRSADKTDEVDEVDALVHIVLSSPVSTPAT